MLFAKVIHGFAVSILRITRAFLGFAIIGATPSLLSFPVDTALNKKKNYNRRTQLVKMDGTGGGSENRKHQKPATYSQETCAELARKPQEEGFAHGLPVRNTPGIRYRSARGGIAVVSRMVAVDNLWITMGLIHMPRNRAKTPHAGVLGVPATIPYPCPRSSIVARLRPIAGHCLRPENPRQTIGEEKPHGLRRGAWWWPVAVIPIRPATHPCRYSRLCPVRRECPR